MAIAIIGAGIAGLSLARELRRRGADVLLVDAVTPGREATWAAAGMLSPLAEARQPGDFFELCRAASAFYPDYVHALEDETGIDAGYRAAGALFLYHDDGQRRELAERFAWQREAGFPVVHLDYQEVRVMEPSVNAAGGYLLPGEAQVDNRALARALVASCRRMQVTFIEAEADGVAVSGGRATGVALRDGNTVEAAAVVNAAGAWAAQITSPAPRVPVRPVKGHMVAFDAGSSAPRLVLHDLDIYLVPRANGRVIAGSTQEEAGFDKQVDPMVIERLRAAAVRLAPRLAGVAVAETWAGLRPGTPDGRPIIGRSSLPGYYLATGYFRNGILLAPLVASLLAAAIADETDSADPLIAPFAPRP